MERHRPEVARSLRNAKKPVLTPLQARFLARYASGASLSEIAQTESFSERRIDELSRIIKKRLAADNLAQAVLIAHQLGYISLPDENLIVHYRSAELRSK